MKRILFAALLALSAACSSAPAPSPTTEAPADGEAIRRAASPLAGASADYDRLLGAIGDARFVLLGESTHGTHEFYRERARITERLLRERGFGAVAIEADWPDAERVNRYVRGLGPDRTAEQALRGFERFPRWMWRNTDFRGFVERLRAHNLTQPPERRVGVYGIDVYSLREAADAVEAYLAAQDRSAADRARAHYRCFRTAGWDAQAYGLWTDERRSCREQALAVLALVQARPRPADPVQAEARFAAVRSAFSVVAAEEYFRTLHTAGDAWNERDQRMAITVEEIAAHIGGASGAPGKVVVWAHNTHVGDARATSATETGQLNLGELMRRRGSAFLVGFLTHGGAVMAAPEWDAPGRVYELRPAIQESYAGLFKALGLGDALILLRGAAAGMPPRLERAVGVVYARGEERRRHYFRARLPEQFDAVVYIERSRAVTPLS